MKQIQIGKTFPPTFILCGSLAAAVCLFGIPAAHAIGIPVGGSSLIGVLDYSDTFTGTADGGRPNRPYVAAMQPSAAYAVENTHGNPFGQLPVIWAGGWRG